MSICVLCGEVIRNGEISLVLRRYREFSPWEDGAPRRIPISFENGSMERVVHDLCPSEFGAPLALVGADGSRADV